MPLRLLFRKLFSRSTYRAMIVEREERRLKELRKRESLDKRVRFMKYPKLSVTQEQLDLIPNGSDIDLNQCPLGTFFRANHDNEFLNDLIVVGQVVEGNKLFCDQYNGNLCVPQRGINRYLVELIGTQAV